MRGTRLVTILSISMLLCGCSFSDKFYEPSTDFQEIAYANFEHIWFNYKNTRIHSLLLLPEADKCNGRALILMKGRGGNASHWYEFAMPMVQAGYHVWIPEYPGHGLSEGKPGHRSIYRSMHAVVGEMIDHGPVSKLDLAFWGFSMGANLTTKLAANYQNRIKGVITDGGCSAFGDLAVGTTEGGGFFTRLFVASPYPAKKNVMQFPGTKLLVIHSEDDEVMPIEMGELLYNNAVGPKSFWRVSGGHCHTVHIFPDEYLTRLEWVFQD